MDWHTYMTLMRIRAWPLLPYHDLHTVHTLMDVPPPHIHLHSTYTYTHKHTDRVTHRWWHSPPLCSTLFSDIRWQMCSTYFVLIELNMSRRVMSAGTQTATGSNELFTITHIRVSKFGSLLRTKRWIITGCVFPLYKNTFTLVVMYIPLPISS